ncbi:MAG: glycosyltransferase [Nitrospinae bacterium]|nr:glycosyltransferase [Nitrospinota bacterium]
MYDGLRFFTWLHFAALAGLLVYGAHRLLFVFCWLGERRKRENNAPPSMTEFPFVTVQLPLYNERFVAARLIEAAARIDWPAEKLEVQVLDDSTDDTRGIVDETAARLSLRGTNISVIRREGREGYKAGALKHGMTMAKGEFMAIFDADFLPRPDFLVRAMPHFFRPETGMVQARWSFLNAESSWLTRLQSLLLGPHFRIEHLVRFKRGLYFNFNGTAGVWRRKAVESAGGWQSDTVTEDLDLSYRAQLCGWKFVYLDEVSVPSELPVTLAAFRSQQQRWAKGSVQTARKVLPLIFSSSLPASVKFEAAAHLLANVCWLFGTATTLTLYSAVSLRAGAGPHLLLKTDVLMLAAASCAVLSYFYVYIRVRGDGHSIGSLLLLPVFSIGMSPAISLSVVKGFFKDGGFFERTPKFGVLGRQSVPNPALLYRQSAFPYLMMNALFLAYSVPPVLFAWQRGAWTAIPFLALFPAGFTLVIAKDLADMKRAGDD